MASVLDIKIAKALLFILFLAYNVMKQVQFAEIEALWLSRIETWGMHFMSEFFGACIFHIFRSGWTDCRYEFFGYIADRR